MFWIVAAICLIVYFHLICYAPNTKENFLEVKTYVAINLILILFISHYLSEKCKEQDKQSKPAAPVSQQNTPSGQTISTHMETAL